MQHAQLSHSFYLGNSGFRVGWRLSYTNNWEPPFFLPNFGRTERHINLDALGLVGNMRIMICLSQGGLRSPSASSFQPILKLLF